MALAASCWLNAVVNFKITDELMRTPIFQIDAFTNRRFAGNPAAVMPMDDFPADEVLQDIAAENNLAETAFLVPNGGDYYLRWFTPTTEVWTGIEKRVIPGIHAV